MYKILSLEEKNNKILDYNSVLLKAKNVIQKDSMNTFTFIACL